MATVFGQTEKLASLSEPVYQARGCSFIAAQTQTEDESLAYGLAATDQSDQECPPVSIIEKTTWPNLESPTDVWGCGFLRKFPETHLSFPGEEKRSMIGIKTRFFRFSTNTCYPIIGGFNIVRDRQIVCPPGYRYAHDNVCAIIPVEKDLEKQHAAIKNILALHYGPQTSQWEINDQVIEVYGRFVMKVKSDCQAYTFIPMPLPPAVAFREFLLWLLENAISMYERDQQLRNTNTAPYACVKAAALGFKSEFAMAAMGI